MTMTSPPETPAAEDRASPDRQPSLGTVVFGGLLVFVGIAWLLDRLDLIDVDAALLLPGMLMAIGIALVVGAWDGEHSGLVVLGVFVALFTILAATAPISSFDGGIGDRSYAPASAATLEAEYELGIGQMDVDLTRLGPIGRETVSVHVGFGEIVVTVPREIPVMIDARVGAGEVVIFGSTWSGLDVDRTFVDERYVGASSAISLTMEALAGKVEVRR